MFDGDQWQRVTLLMAFAFPSFVFGMVVFMNFFVWAKGSTNAIEFGSMFAVLVRTTPCARAIHVPALHRSLIGGADVSTGAVVFGVRSAGVCWSALRLSQGQA